MAISVGVNSWVTIAEADSYLENKIGTGSWYDLSDTPENPGDSSKESFLVTAYLFLINKPGLVLTSDSTDTNVKYAQIEFAYYLSNNYATFIADSDTLSKGLSSMTLSKWSESYSQSYYSNFSLPTIVAILLSGYLQSDFLEEIRVD